MLDGIVRSKNKFVLFYAQFTIDRKKKVKNHGTFFGDYSHDLIAIKKRGVEITKNFPQIITIQKIFELTDTLDSIALDAQEYFEDFGNKMQEHQTA